MFAGRFSKRNCGAFGSAAGTIGAMKLFWKAVQSGDMGTEKCKYCKKLRLMRYPCKKQTGETMFLATHGRKWADCLLLIANNLFFHAEKILLKHAQAEIPIVSNQVRKTHSGFKLHPFSSKVSINSIFSTFRAAGLCCQKAALTSSAGTKAPRPAGRASGAAWWFFCWLP
ncbi:MAG: hypothetical protein PHO66_08290 [Eubacteriales bacterium]|nr:hypothetical protein [Eubacteriales bacterium]